MWLFRSDDQGRVLPTEKHASTISNDAGCLAQNRLDLILRHCWTRQSSHLKIAPARTGTNSNCSAWPSALVSIHESDLRTSMSTFLAALEALPYFRFSEPLQLDLSLIPIPSNDARCRVASARHGSKNSGQYVDKDLRVSSVHGSFHGGL